MEMLLWVCNPMSRKSKNGNVFIYMANMVDIVTFNENFKMTQESTEFSKDQNVLKLKGKGPMKEKSK
jgi:hypothetical protein